MKLSELLFTYFTTTFSFPISTWTDKHGVTQKSISMKPIDSVNPTVTVADEDITINDDTLNQLFADNNINAIATLRMEGDKYETKEGTKYYAYTRYSIRPLELLDATNASLIDSKF